MKKITRPVWLFFTNMSIMLKITILFIVLSCLSLTICILVSDKLYSEKLWEKTETMSQQNLDTVANSFTMYVNNIDKMSFIVIYDEDLQSFLLNVDESNYHYALSDSKSYINKLFIAIKKQTKDIASFYIYDNNGYKFFRKSELIDMTIDDIREASWYQEVCDENGALTVKINGEGDIERAFTYFTGYDEKKGGFLSLIRAINDLDTQQKVGISVLNVDYSSIDAYLSDILNKYSLDICIWDDNGDRLTDFEGYEVNDEMLAEAVEDGIFKVTGTKGGVGILAAIRIEPYDIYCGCITPVENDLYNTSGLVTIILIANILFMLLGMIIISNIVVKPINDLLVVMKEAERNNFVKITGPYGADEIGKLKDGYNHMISEIEKLFNNIVEEQNLKRKHELNVLLEQVKPHFLYNTFDSISSLALKKGEKEIFSLLSALGEYYKKSLSKGNEIIPLKDEIQIVRSYLFIQSYRYKDLIETAFDVDEEILGVPVLKFVLQPIVENAIIHGIIPKGEAGRITIGAHKADHYIVLTVADDGVGMNRDRYDEIYTGDAPGGKSFGIRGTAERLRLIYKEEGLLSIDIDRDEGVEVTVRIPLEQTGMEDGTPC